MDSSLVHRLDEIEWSMAPPCLIGACYALLVVGRVGILMNKLRWRCEVVPELCGGPCRSLHQAHQSLIELQPDGQATTSEDVRVSISLFPR